jgi:3-dehydroquinate synthase/shikimate kinase/3-dehydroquinate synthase
LLEKFGLPIRYDGPVRAQELLTVIQVDKKVADKRVRWILPRRIGEVTVTTLPDALIEQVLADFFTQES